MRGFLTILPGAFELTENDLVTLYELRVPTRWRQVANALAVDRSQRQGKRKGVPVYSLDPLLKACFSPILHTFRKSWFPEDNGRPWLFSYEPTSTSDLSVFIKDWLRAEYGSSLGEEEVNSRLECLEDTDWDWGRARIYSLMEPETDVDREVQFRAIPNYLAQKFLEGGEVYFGEDDKYALTFYQVATLNGAEFMSWPPSSVPLYSNGKRQEEEADISFVIRFRLHTVPGRKKPLVYHELLTRRWITNPLNPIPYKGIKAYIGDSRRWLDGVHQDFCFMPLVMKRYGWPSAISKLLCFNDSSCPAVDRLAANQEHNWGIPNNENLQAAIAYNNKGKAPCSAGVSPLDLASLDKAILERLPVSRCGEGVRVNINHAAVDIWGVEKKQEKPEEPELLEASEQETDATENKKNKPKPLKDAEELETPMLRPSFAAPLVFQSSLGTILILWETEPCRDTLIEEICKILCLHEQGEVVAVKQISPGVELHTITYQSDYGSFCIKTLPVNGITDYLNVEKGSEEQRLLQRLQETEKRGKEIRKYLPLGDETCGAIVEIKPKPKYIVERDSKLAIRIGVMQSGYLNQHILRIFLSTNQETSEKYISRKSRERARRAVSDLFRQFGVMPRDLVSYEVDGIDPYMWLMCFNVLRRTKKTTASNKASTVVLMVRVNPITGKVEFTTPELFQSQGWVSSYTAHSHLLSQKWDADAYVEEEPNTREDKTRKREREKRIINKFVADCLEDCLATPIDVAECPNILLMVEAQNSRNMLNWARNLDLVEISVYADSSIGDFPLELQEYITKPEDIDRISIARLREKKTTGEVPVAIVKDSPGSRTKGLFRWKGVCDETSCPLYLSVRDALNTEKYPLKTTESRLDNGSGHAANRKLLEIAIIHSGMHDADTLVALVHNLRNRWPYYADETCLPFPFPFASLAKEYAVSARDIPEVDEEDEDADSNEEEELEAVQLSLDLWGSTGI